MHGQARSHGSGSLIAIDLETLKPFLSAVGNSLVSIVGGLE